MSPAKEKINYIKDTHLASLVIHCRKFHEGQGVPQKTNSTNARYKTTKTRDLPALVCPTCSRQCMSKSGLTLHRVSRHGYKPTRAPQSQRDECEETALHLLSCPTLHPLRVQFTIIDDVPLMKLCFSKRLAKFLIAVERNYTMPEFSQPRIPRQPTSPSVRPPHLFKISDGHDHGNPDRRVSSRRLSLTKNKQQNK
ncbi:Tbingi protein [Trypanosoma theileri]|uniref:Tbingi protein n=1 Tax=Trypanosoma theileri TaxID=67003 RepID=A0A1X0NI73_9TRYP|nr:Tbingi protein [Trypanosoma theileri]ORC84452.1 Tbingi protein [Trypanosoma theileri]